MRQPPARIGRDVLAARVVERRIHQHPVDAGRHQPGGVERLHILGVGLKRPHPVVQPVEPRVLGSQRAQHRVDLDQRDMQAADAHGEREASAADAGAEIDRLLTRVSAGGGGEQDRIVADTMTAQRLAQPQPAAEHGVFAGRESGALRHFACA